MKRGGFTLVEVIFVSALLVVFMTTVYTVGANLHETAGIYDAKALAYDEARGGLDVVVREIRQAALAEVSAMPAASLSYRVAEDLDGNGVPLDAKGNLELSPLRTISRDYEDRNGDGLGATQLVLIEGDRVRVLANGLAPDEDANGKGLLDGDKDANREIGVPGVWFEPCGAGIRVTIRTVRHSSAGKYGHPMTACLTEVVFPRN